MSNHTNTPRKILADHIYMDLNTHVTKLNNNDLIIGPSGAGKTRNYVKPNIMQCNNSMIIADTKSNLLYDLGPLLRKKGYKILNVDFKDLSKSSGYNPFDFIRYNPKTGKYSEQDILTIANTLCPQTMSHDPFWDNAAKLYMSSLIAYVVECLPRKEHNLDSVYELFAHMSTPVTRNLMTQLERENPKSYAAKQFRAFRNNGRAEKMDQSIIGISLEKLAPLVLDDLVTMYQSENRINFKSLGHEKTAIFLSISDTDRSMDRLTSLFYTQALQILCNEADSLKSSRLPVPVHFYFDDFATNTIIPDFDNIISVIRSREISVSIILQSISQLNAIYGPEKTHTILNNCDNCLYLGGQDIDTANYISIKVNKPLNDVLNMPLDKAFLCTRGRQPREVKKFDITAHENYHNLQSVNDEDLCDFDDDKDLPFY